MNKVGVFGGTFDPVHLGHLQLAEQAVELLDLAHLLFVPAAHPPHKDQGVTDIRHRIAMLELVCKHSERLSCCDIECRLPAPSYTIDTLTALKTAVYDDSELVFLIGVDAFLEIESWKEYEAVLCMVEIVISPRVGWYLSSLTDFLKSLGYEKKGLSWEGRGERKKITILSDFPQGSCSTELRNDVTKDNIRADHLSPEVARYIEENSLYNQ